VSNDDAHLSIGEVLAELRDEFPDITISKIRFLESQGLVDPERTPSGYRKFYAADLARLRWILQQQRELFLPLKVIKERLDALPPGAEPSLLEAVAAPAAAAAAPTEDRTAARSAGARPATATAGARPPRRTPSLFAPTLPIDDGATDEVVAERAGPSEGYRLAEVAAAAGLEEAQVRELEEYGLLAPAREVDGVARYDDDAVTVARVAAGFFGRGVEARHLRMYRTAAEREALLFAQVLLPYVRQRNPEARERLQEELVELATLGRRLRTALLRGAIRESLAE